MSKTGSGVSARNKVEPIFVISAQRSGSTLLQQMLGRHPLIATESEPWLVLPLIYARRTQGIWAEYDAFDNRRGWKEPLEVFLERTDAVNLFDECVRTFVNTIYAHASNKAGAVYFLDKTPRNYLITDDLRRIFPNAKLVYLLRHPLAIFSSLLDSTNGDWKAVFSSPGRRMDLMRAPGMISRAVRREIDPITVRYEELVATPERVMPRLCEKLGVDFDRCTLSYDAPEETFWGDQVNVRKHDAPVTDYTEKWRLRLGEYSAFDIAKAYIESLDCDELTLYGVHKAALLQDLVDLGAKPKSRRLERLLAASPNSHATDDALATARHGMVRGIWRRFLSRVNR